MRFSVYLATVAVAIEVLAAEDLRSPFDKSDYLDTVAVQVNPWFPLDKPDADAYGGPNVPWIRGLDWEKGMRLCAEYGVNAFVPEINEPSAWTGVWRELLDASAKCGGLVKVGMFFGFHSKTADDSIKSMKRILGGFRKDLRDNPCVLRAGGCPVMVVYGPRKYSVEEWKRIFDALDAEFGRMVYLANFRSLAMKPGGSGDTEENFELRLRKILQVFDGVSNYGSAGIESQKMCARVLKRVMKEYPQKIYEGGIHSTYTCHFHMGGLEVHLSHEWRESVDTYFASDPDSEMLTNLFDHYENSLVYPCYEREDLLLRYLEYALSKWKGRPFRKEKTPELVLTNHNTIQLGWENLDFEVMGFPIDSKATEVEVTLDLCNTAGKVLKSFPPRKMKLDDFRVEAYSVPSVEFASERGIVPRIRYRWQGKERVTGFNPMTFVSPSLRSYHMYWARSTRNRLQSNGELDWTIDGVGPGGTLVSRGGPSLFTSHLRNRGWANVPNQGYARQAVKRDGSDFYVTNDGRLQLKCAQMHHLQNPGGGLHWYHLEIENQLGRKEATLPIWTTNGSRSGEVAVPVWQKDANIISDRQIEAARVPYWYYPCKRDGGKFLVDMSGYCHNGSINGSGYGGGHLGHTGYNHYHNAAIEAPKTDWRPLFVQEGETGFLRLKGRDYAVVMGGTAFPGASTYEICVRPSELGGEMGLFGSGNNQISLDVLPDGSVRAARRSENEGVAGAPRKGAFVNNTVVSKAKLEVGEWTRLAVVYDLRKLVLYVNGERQGEVESKPIENHEWETHLIIGAKCKWVWEPYDNFKGDIRDVRIYGRNLSPAEFLR